MKENLLSDLLSQRAIKLLFKIFDDYSKEICLVGGCVRDAFLGKLSQDIDVAANVLPREIVESVNKNNIEYEDYAYKYGSITAYIEDQKFQITTLREDINQIGRHTNIIFTNDWKKDAARRDFTINSIYLSSNGKLKDFFNGKKDLDNSTIRFIGNIEESVQEDFLRLFRYYRFLGIFEIPKLIEDYDNILFKYCEISFNYLSNDIIRQEILKMFNTSYPLNSFFDIMRDKKKRYWVELTKNYFVDTKYDLGLNRCLNKVDLLIN